MEVRSLSRLQDLWHFIAKENSIDPKDFKSLTEFQKDRIQLISLSLIQDNLDFSIIFHYTAEAYTPMNGCEKIYDI